MVLCLQNQVKLRPEGGSEVQKTLFSVRSYWMQNLSSKSIFLRNWKIIDWSKMAARNVRSGIALFQLFLYKYILEFRWNFNEKRLKMALKPHQMHLLFQIKLKWMDSMDLFCILMPHLSYLYIFHAFLMQKWLKIGCRNFKKPLFQFFFQYLFWN